MILFLCSDWLLSGLDLPTGITGYSEPFNAQGGGGGGGSVRKRQHRFRLFWANSGITKLKNASLFPVNVEREARLQSNYKTRHHFRLIGIEKVISCGKYLIRG